MLNLFKNYPRYLSFGLVTMFFASFGQTFLLSFFNVGIEANLNITSGELAQIYAIATLISGFGLPWFGRKLDISSTKYYACGVALVIAFAFMLLAYANNIFVLLLALVLIRLFGQSLLPMSAMTFMTRYFGQYRGRALSISSFGRSIAEGLLPVLVGFLLLQVEFSATVLILAGGLIFLYTPIVFFTLKQGDPAQPFFQDKQSTSPQHQYQSVQARELFRDLRFWILSFCNIVLPFGLTGIFFMHHKLGAELNWTTTDWASGFIFYSMTQISFNLLGGLLIDKFSARKVMPFVLIPFITGLSFLLYFHLRLDGRALVFFALAFFGASVGLVGNVKSSFFAEKYGLASLGAIKSFDATIIVISTAASPVFMGAVLEHFGVIRLIQILFAITFIGIIGHCFISIDASKKLKRLHVHI